MSATNALNHVMCSLFPFFQQFQSFMQFRGKLKSRSSEEIQLLKDKPTVWNIHSILNVLYSLVEKSNINEQVREAGREIASSVIPN